VVAEAGYLAALCVF